VTDELRRVGIRASADLRNEKINYKVREHSLAKVPAILALGKREMSENTVSIRRLGAKTQSVLPLDQALADLQSENRATGQP
jgi:threonyl-tRNA synthetase